MPVQLPSGTLTELRLPTRSRASSGSPTCRAPRTWPWLVGAGNKPSVMLGAQGRTIDYWIAALPVVWNIVLNGREAIMG